MPFFKLSAFKKNTLILTPKTATLSTDQATQARNVACQEIVSTEKSYLASLHVLLDLYLRPLSGSRILSDKEISAVFSNIETILLLNTRLLGDLEVHMKYEAPRQLIGGLFLEFAPYFKMYSNYVKDNETSSRLVAKLLANNKKFSDFCDAASRETRSKGLTLSSLLIMPIQRIPRYRLLLEQLVRVTPTSYNDYLDLSRASQLLNGIASYINLEVQAQENRNQIRDIDERFSTEEAFLSPGRFFIKGGELAKRSRTSSTMYTFYLFNNLLAYASKKLVGRGLTLVASIPIDSSFSAHELDDTSFKEINSKGLERDKVFAVTSSMSSFVCMCTSADEQKEWLAAMRESIDQQKDLNTFEIQNSSEAEQKGLWVDSSVAKQCAVCNANFTVFRAKHHCRQCGQCVCDACTLHRELSSNRGITKMKRVCVRCDALLKALELNSVTQVQTTTSTGAHASSLPSTVSTLISIVDWIRDEKQNNTNYNICLARNGVALCAPVPKQYNDFTTLDNALRKIVAVEGRRQSVEEKHALLMPSLPKSLLLSPKDPAILEERRGILQAYLREVYQLVPAYPLVRPTLAKWLGIEEGLLLSTKEQSNCSLM